MTKLVVRSLFGDPICFANPKSDILTTPEEFIRILEVVRSLWIIKVSCKGKSPIFFKNLGGMGYLLLFIVKLILYRLCLSFNKFLANRCSNILKPKKLINLKYKHLLIL